MEERIRAICRQVGIKAGTIEPLKGGQVNQVYRIDEEYVLRIGAREQAYQRLKRETELLGSLPKDIPVPEVYAFGEQDELVYQVQRFIPGQKLYAVWKNLRPAVQESIAADLGRYLKILHSQPAAHFGYLYEEPQPYAAWGDYLAARFERTLAELEAYHIRLAPGFVELARDYFDEHKHVLQEGAPVIVHGDLSFVNILVNNGRVAALIDFEYAMQAPRDYELWVMEEFCLYPNDFAEEENEVYCAGDFAGFLPLLRKHDPELFAVPNLRKRVDLYHLEAALSSYLAWRKDNLDHIPAESMAAKEFYMARITNFIFRNGVRLF